MTRPRDREGSKGLLPLMEAHPRKGGFTTYRYHPRGGKPINLGRDRQVAIQKVLDLNGNQSDKGTINGLWRVYQDSPQWKGLSPGSQADYKQGSKPLLAVFGEMSPRALKPSHINQYLRVERKDAPVRANREFALLSNLMNVAVSRGDMDVNPCKQVRRNTERPRKQAPDPANLAKFLEWAWAQKGQAPVLAGMAEFTSITGNRGVEFKEMTWPQIGDKEIRLIRAKQRGGADSQVVEVLAIDDRMRDLLVRLRARAFDPRIGTVFANSQGNPYNDQSFKLAFARLKTAARAAGVLPVNFTFHDLRSYFVTQYKKKHGELPELHADKATTARIYDSSREVKRPTL